MLFYHTCLNALALKITELGTRNVYLMSIVFWKDLNKNYKKNQMANAFRYQGCQMNKREQSPVILANVHKDKFAIGLEGTEQWMVLT